MTQPSDPIDLNADSSELLARNDASIHNTISSIDAATDQAKDAKAQTDRIGKVVNDVAEAITDAGQVIKTTGV